MRSMFTSVPVPTGYGQITRVEVALPFVDALVDDDSGKYYLERKRLEVTPSAAATATEVRRCVRWSSWQWHATAPSDSASGCASGSNSGRTAPPSRPRPRPTHRQGVVRISPTQDPAAREAAASDAKRPGLGRPQGSRCSSRCYWTDQYLLCGCDRRRVDLGQGWLALARRLMRCHLDCRAARCRISARDAVENGLVRYPRHPD